MMELVQSKKIAAIMLVCLQMTSCKQKTKEERVIVDGSSVEKNEQQEKFQASMQNSMKALEERLNQAVKGEANEDNLLSLKVIEEKLQNLEKLSQKSDVKKTNFYLKCVQSLNEKDADDSLRNQVVNAIALVNTSKVARATALSQKDFQQLSKINTSNYVDGLVYIGTIDPLRDVNSSYTYYAFNRLPSLENFSRLNYHGLKIDGENGDLVTYADESTNEFLRGDQLSHLKSSSMYDLIATQDPQLAIDANRIESYNRDDCEKTATYMSNVGAKALNDRVDEMLFRSSHYNTENDADTFVDFGRQIRQKEGITRVVSDELEWLNRRWEKVRSTELKRNYVDRDSKRIIVLQDQLMRKNDRGVIDYSFLDLIEMPHLRYFAAVDSQIGESSRTSADFDNDYAGKNPSLISFVSRHHRPGESRSSNNYKGLEAVFIHMKSPEVVQPVEAPRPADNLFHVPKVQ